MTLKCKDFSESSIPRLGPCYSSFDLSDGYCDDTSNIEECGFDGGDCCGSSVNTDMCMECTCKTLGIVQRL